MTVVDLPLTLQYASGHFLISTIPGKPDGHSNLWREELKSFTQRLYRC